MSLQTLILLTFSAERPPGYDRVRNAEIGNKDFELDVLEEAYTTEHWLVRIYKVKANLLNLQQKIRPLNEICPVSHKWCC